MQPFTFTTRDAYGRQVRRFDLTAATIAAMGCGLGILLISNTGFLMLGAKIVGRIAGL